MEEIKYTLIIPAAGSGTRLGSDLPKQFLKIKEKEILIHSIEAFIRSDNPPEKIILSCSEGSIDLLDKLLTKYKIRNYELVIGGKTRQESVFNALKKITDFKYVLIHDSVRPFVSGSIINQLLRSLQEYKAVIPVLAVKDTIKIIKDGIVESTPKRSELYAAQTPQGFDYNTIMNANHLAKDLANITDDASLIELLGGEVRVIQGDEKNFKITTKDDLERAKNLI